MSPSSRIAAGFAVSAAIHLLLAVSISQRVTNEATSPSPLRVEIVRTTPPEKETETADPGLSNSMATVTPVQISTATHAKKQSPSPLANNAAALQLDLPFDRYFTAQELDVRAVQINDVQLVYPKQAYEMRISGKATLRIFINEQGGIDMVSLLAATPPGVFDETALTAVQMLQFSPALKNGLQVKSQKTIEVDFDPYERINMPW